MGVMSAADIELRASEFVARYPRSGLNAEAVGAAWQNYPEAAMLQTGVKAERIEQINKMLMRADIDPVKLVRLVGLNPAAIQRPAQQFLGQYAQMASALSELSLQPPVFMEMMLQEPSLATMPLASMLMPIGYLAGRMAEYGLPPALLGKALVNTPRLLPLLCEMEDVGLMQLNNRIGQRHNFADGKPSERDKGIMRDELQLLLTHPESMIASYLPQRNLVDAEAAAPLNLVRQTDAVKKFLGAKAPSEAEIARLLQSNPQQAIIANLTAEDITDYLRKARQSFSSAGTRSQTFYLKRLLGSGYMPNKGTDVAADLDAVFGDAFELKKRIGRLHAPSFVVKAAANTELRELGIDRIVENQQGLFEYLQPYGISERTIQLTCARYHPLYTVTPEAARAHVREVVDYFDDPEFTEADYLRCVTTTRKLALRALATPSGQVRQTFDELKDLLQVGKPRLLSMVRETPVTTSYPFAYYVSRIDDMYNVVAPRGLERRDIIDFASADLTFFTRRTAQMGHEFNEFCERMQETGLGARDLLIKARQKGFASGSPLPRDLAEITHAPRVEPQLRTDTPSVSVMVRRQQDRQEKLDGLAGLGEFLAPYGIADNSLQHAAARNEQLYTTTPAQALAHVREVTDYFADPSFGVEDYLKLVTQQTTRDLHCLATPAGQPTRFFRELEESYGVKRQQILREVKSVPGFVRRTLAECDERVDAMHAAIVPFGVTREDVRSFAADDLTFFNRDAAKLGERFASLYDHMSQYGMTAAELMRCARMKPALLTSNTQTVTANVDSVFRRLPSAGLESRQYTEVLKTRPELFFYKPERVWDNFLLVREAYNDGSMEPSRQARAIGDTPSAWVLANSIALAFSTDMLALRRVWAREARGGGKVDNYLKIGIAQIQNELAEKLGPSTDFAALAARELVDLGQKIDHTFADPVPASAKKGWGKRAPMAG